MLRKIDINLCKIISYSDTFCQGLKKSLEANRILQGRPFNCYENPDVVQKMQLQPSPRPDTKCPEGFEWCENVDGNRDLVCNVIEATKSTTKAVATAPTARALRLRITIIIIIRKDRVDVYILIQW